MKEDPKNSVGKKQSDHDPTDEIGSDPATGREVNVTIEQQGKDAAAGIPRDTYAAKEERKQNETTDDMPELRGAP